MEFSPGWLKSHSAVVAPSEVQFTDLGEHSTPPCLQALDEEYLVGGMDRWCVCVGGGGWGGGGGTACMGGAARPAMESADEQLGPGVAYFPLGFCVLHAPQAARPPACCVLHWPSCRRAPSLAGPQKPLFGGRTTNSRTRLSDLGAGSYQGVGLDGSGAPGADTEIQMQQPQGGGC